MEEIQTWIILPQRKARLLWRGTGKFGHYASRCTQNVCPHAAVVCHALPHYILFNDKRSTLVVVPLGERI